MKISFNWLKAHLDFDGSAADLSSLLLKIGFEVAGVERLGPQFSGVVVGKVVAKDKHPNADKLAVCVVDDGAQKWNVVCGAPNVAAGQTIAFARIGAVLPGGFKIGKAKLRGVESQGMICSRAELGLPKDVDGIWVMGEGPSLGSDVGTLLGPADDVLEVEVTSNRPDCLSHRGLARELAAATGKNLKSLDFPLHESLGDQFPIHVDDAVACPYYSVRLIEGVKVGPSSETMRRRLEAIGLRPINNVVDVTNYVLHGLGQPLHAFDADKLSGGKIIVRRSRPGEKLLALDHKTYELPEGLLVIADAVKPVALAGVMGGLDTAVTETTTRVVLESAYFAPSEVRRSSQKTRLRSDSSYRFERGVDPEASAFSSSRAASMIVELGGRKAGKASEALGTLPRNREIKTTISRLNALLGSTFTADEISRVLGAIAADFKQIGDSLSFRAPSWRRDLSTANDLAEEVGRFLGYNRIPYRLGALAPRAATISPVENISRKVRSRLTALGLTEVYNYDLLSEKTLSCARLSAESLPRVANPLSEDWAVLRPTLLPGLLKNAAYNLSRGSDAVRFFELGKVYSNKDGSVAESWRVAGIMLGPVLDARWQPARAPKAGFYDAKACVEDMMLSRQKIDWKTTGAKSPSDPLLHPANSLRAFVGGIQVATVGWLHPRAARAFDLDGEGAVIFELDLDWLARTPQLRAKFVEFSSLPSSCRDLALVVDNGVAFEVIWDIVFSCAINELKAVDIFDVYMGKNIPDGKKSLAIRLEFGASDRTLTDAEVAGFVEKIVAALAAKTGAVLRS